MVASMELAANAANLVGAPPTCTSTTSFSGLKPSVVNKNLVARSAPAPKRDTATRFPFKTIADLKGKRVAVQHFRPIRTRAKARQRQRFTFQLRYRFDFLTRNHTIN